MGWYFDILHDRFFSQWDQPTSVTESNDRFATTVLLRIEKDGRISKATVVGSSGNPVMDDSVKDALKRVSRVPPLPEPLAKSAPFEVKINFELE